MSKLERLIKNAICPMYEAQKAKEDMKYQQKKTPFVFECINYSKVPGACQKARASFSSDCIHI